eukprot:1158187-Pelagomonas_calceolata.AAC.12
MYEFLDLLLADMDQPQADQLNIPHPRPPLLPLASLSAACLTLLNSAEDQSQADQPNSLAEGPPVHLLLQLSCPCRQQSKFQAADASGQADISLCGRLHHFKRITSAERSQPCFVKTCALLKPGGKAPQAVNKRFPKSDHQQQRLAK